MAKTDRALTEFPVRQLILAGGVAANSGLRADLTAMMEKHHPEVALLKAPLALCGDNAAMIGAAGYVAWQHGVRADLALNADPSLEFDWRSGMLP